MNQATPLGQDDLSVDAAQLYHGCRDSAPRSPLHACPSRRDGMDAGGEQEHADWHPWGCSTRLGLSPALPNHPQCCPSMGLCSGQVAPVLALRVRQVFHKDGKGT